MTPAQSPSLQHPEPRGVVRHLNKKGILSLLSSAFRVLVWIALMITLGLNVWTVRQTARAVSNVPWRDQWWFIGELAAYLAGGSWWPTLWNVYWGHRCVLTRLIFLADAKLFALANSPLVALIFALQALEAGLFIFVAKLLGTGRSVKMIL